MKKAEFLDPRAVTLLIALAIALAISVHPAFLLIGFAIAVGALILTVAQAIREQVRRSMPSHRHP